jgi:hypothetical protein
MMFPLVALCVCALLVHGCPRSVLLLSDPLFVLAARALVGRVFFCHVQHLVIFLSPPGDSWSHLSVLYHGLLVAPPCAIFTDTSFFRKSCSWSMQFVATVAVAVARPAAIV